MKSASPVLFRRSMLSQPHPNTDLSTKANFCGPLATVGFVLLLALMPFGLKAQDENVINTIAGGGPTPSDPLQADIAGPTATIRNAAGDLYIAAPFAAYIYKLSKGGGFGIYSGLGYGGFGGDGGAVGNAQLGYPAAFAYDSAGNLYIADFGTSRIRKVDTGGIITTVAGQAMKCAHSNNPCGDGGPATSAQLNLPQGVAVDSAGNIYIADGSDNRIRKVDTSGIITTVVGTGTRCANPTAICGDGGPATAAHLNNPQGVAVDSAGNIYIADTGDNRVRIVSGGIINNFAGNGGACLDSTKPCGDGGLAINANLRGPASLALDSTGNAYVADSKDHRIRKVDISGNITKFAGNGTQGYAGDGGSALLAELDLPAGVYVDPAGNVVISDTGNQRVRQVDSTGNIQLLAGGGSGGDGQPAVNATLAGPYALTEDSSGNVYFADQYNNRVRRLANDGNRTISTVAGTGSAGYSGDGGPATLAMLNAPSSLALDGKGGLYIADENNFRVRKLDLNTGVITLFAGSGASCFPTTDACGDGGPATSATFASPQTLALDAAGNVYIADYFAHRIRQVKTTGIHAGSISTFAGTGQAGDTGDGGPAKKATLNHPSGVAVDTKGNVYISDQYNFRIRRVNKKGTISAFALNEQPRLGGDGGPALNGSMWNPLEVTTDPANNVFVSGGNDRVVQIIDAATRYWGTVAGNSKRAVVGGFSGDGGPAQSARLANAGSSVDGAGNLYIADQGNNRVRHVLLASALTNTPLSLSFGNVPLNQASVPQTVTTLDSGGLDLNLISVAITGTNASNFAVNNSCPVFVAPNRKCTGSVTFTPTNYGKYAATLTFSDNAAGSPQSVSLAGSGPDFTISAAPSSMTIAKGSLGTSTITLAPLGQFNQTIGLSSSGCPPNSGCTITPNSVTLDGTNNGTATFDIQTGSSTRSGTYIITVLGVFTPLQHPVTVTVTVP